MLVAGIRQLGDPDYSRRIVVILVSCHLTLVTNISSNISRVLNLVKYIQSLHLKLSDVYDIFSLMPLKTTIERSVGSRKERVDIEDATSFGLTRGQAAEFFGMYPATLRNYSGPGVEKVKFSPGREVVMLTDIALLSIAQALIRKREGGIFWSLRPGDRFLTEGVASNTAIFTYINSRKKSTITRTMILHTPKES
jgi:hypothetical protein